MFTLEWMLFFAFYCVRFYALMLALKCIFSCVCPDPKKTNDMRSKVAAIVTILLNVF